MSDAVLEFASTLNETIRDHAEQGIPFSTETECFAQEILEMFEGAGVVEDAEVCVQGGRLSGGQWQIAGWAFPPSEDEDLSQLSILATVFLDSPEPVQVPAADIRRAWEQAFRFVREMLEGRADDLEPAADAAALGRIIHERRKQLRRVTIHVATDGQTMRLKELESQTVGKIEVAGMVWDIDRLSRLSSPAPDEIEIDVKEALGQGLPCLHVPDQDEAYDAFLCVVPGELLYRMYEQFGQRLLELNVRSFLSITGKVNKGIRSTIREEPSRFFPYNNGLAMTASGVRVEKHPDGHQQIVGITGLQIVNGGQTTASIHRAKKLDGADISHVFVQAKLTVITAREDNEQFLAMVKQISRFANSQNAVKADDLGANDPWHIELEKLSRKVWVPDASSQWFYERARGSYTVAKLRASTTPAKRKEFERKWPKAQVVAKTDLAKYMNAWELHPEIVSLGGQKNFAHFTGRLGDQARNPRLDEDTYKRIMATVILYRGAAGVVNELKHAIPAFRANVVAYLVAYLSYRTKGQLNFMRIWEDQQLPEPVALTLSAWAVPIYRAIIQSAGARNPSEWAKKPECWDAVRALQLEAAPGFEKHAGGSALRLSMHDASGTGSDAEAIQACLRLPRDEWERLADWSASAPGLHYKQVGIVQTLRGYAAAGWSKRPSEKQARAVLKVMERWQEESETARA